MILSTVLAFSFLWSLALTVDEILGLAIAWLDQMQLTGYIQAALLIVVAGVALGIIIRRVGGD